VVQNAIDIWGSFGKLQAKMAPKDLINYSFASSPAPDPHSP
jgi:hypothetical protein